MPTLLKNIRAQGQLNIITALACEAAPLIHYYGLKKILAVQSFDVYKNQTGNMHLIISGVGKVNAAAAVSFLQHYTGDADWTCLCNIGIAGGGDVTLGAWMLANKIIDQANGRTWYPKLHYLPRMPQAALHCCDTPQQVYSAGTLVDMESAGVFQAAGLFLAQEHIQIIKVVSDNDAPSRLQINPEYVRGLITKNMQAIDEILRVLLDLSQQEQTLRREPLAYQTFIETWHFTEYQKKQLKDYLRRFEVCLPAEDPHEFCRGVSGARNILSYLQQHLRTAVL